MPHIVLNPNPNRLEFELSIATTFDILNKSIITHTKHTPRVPALADHKYAMVTTFNEVFTSKKAMIHSYIFLTAILREEEIEHTDEFAQLIISDSVRRAFHRLLECESTMSDIIIQQAHDNELFFDTEEGYRKDYSLDIAQISINEAEYFLEKMDKPNIIKELMNEFDITLEMLASTSILHDLSYSDCFIDYYLINAFIQPMNYDLRIDDLYKEIQQASSKD